MTHRLVFFCSEPATLAIEFIRCIDSNIASDQDIEIVAIIVGVNPFSRSLQASQSNIDNKLGELKNFAQDHRIPIFMAMRGQVNETEFLDTMFKRFNPTVAISLYFTEIFGPSFLSRFKQIINFHNGVLPAYRGLMASAWAIANGEQTAGYTFHRIDESIDTGNILIEGQVDIDDIDTTETLEKKILEDAKKHLPTLIACINSNNLGREQVGESNYYSFKDLKLVRKIQHPEKIDAARLSRLPRAFGPIKMMLHGKWQAIFAICEATNNDLVNGRIYFFSEDNKKMEATVSSTSI